MIKINLLQTGAIRKDKKKTEDQTQLFVVGGSTVATILLCAYVFWYVPNGTIAQLQGEQNLAQQELTRLQEQVKVVDDFEKNRKALENKNEIIRNLRKKQSGPVHVLDDLSNKLPDRVWIKSFTESNGLIKLEGNALSNADIVDYIDNLESSSYFTNVQLQESRKKMEKNIPIYSFKLRMKVVI